MTDAIDSAAVHAARALAGTPGFAMPGAFCVSHTQKVSFTMRIFSQLSAPPPVSRPEIITPPLSAALELFESPEAAPVVTGSIFPGLNHRAATRKR